MVGGMLAAVAAALSVCVILCHAQHGDTAVPRSLRQVQPGDRIESIPTVSLLPVEDHRRPECPPGWQEVKVRCGRYLMAPSFEDTLPDLTVLRTWIVPDSICPSDTVDIHSTIKNIGVADVQDSFYFDMWFDGYNIGYARLDGLPAGDERELVRDEFVWPADGYIHAVTAMADTDHEIAETDTTNNIHLEWFAADWCGTCKLVSVPFGTGWNWFSLNVGDQDMSLDNVLSSLDSSAVYIKNQVSFAEYVPVLGGWFGTLDSLSCLEAYLIKLAFPDTLEFCGLPQEETAPIALATGWNWIPYLPEDQMDVDPALASLATNGIYIKNQVSFAEYVPVLGSWLGTLEQMNPLDGYKIKMASADVLVYPGGTLLAARVSEYHRSKGSVIQGKPRWAVRPGDYELTGSVTAVVSAGGRESVGGALLAAFAGGECRGVQTAREIPGGRCLFFLTVYGREEGEDLTFKYYDGRGGPICGVTESLKFSSDMILGRSLSPVELTVLTSAVEPIGGHKAEGVAVHTNYPDPFSDATTIVFSVAGGGGVRVEIFDVKGRRITTLADGDHEAGRHWLAWDGKDGGGIPVAGGIYFCRIETDAAALVEKMVLLR